MKEFLTSTKGKIAAAAVGILVVIGIILLATGSAGAANTTRGIGLDKSVAVALADAGLKEDQVANLQGHFETDDGLDAYDVSFTANNYEYEYTIKASDGAILECKIESPEGLHVTAEEARDIGQDKALSQALAHAGLKKSEVELTKSRKSSDDGAIVYEFDFLKDNVEYEYEVDGTTGGVREFSREVLDKKAGTSADGNSSQAGGTLEDSGSGSSNGSDSSGSSGGKDSAADNGGGSSSYIGADKAKSIALSDAGVKAATATFTTAKLDRDDGRYVYEIDFYTTDTEYDYEIDATTGKILERDSEPLDDRDDDDGWDADEDWDDDED